MNRLGSVIECRDCRVVPLKNEFNYVCGCVSVIELEFAEMCSSNRRME